MTRHGEPSRGRHEPAWSPTSPAFVDEPEALQLRLAAKCLNWLHRMRGFVHLPLWRIARRKPWRPPMSGAPKPVLPIPLSPPTESTAPLRSAPNGRRVRESKTKWYDLEIFQFCSSTFERFKFRTIQNAPDGAAKKLRTVARATNVHRRSRAIAAGLPCLVTICSMRRVASTPQLNRAQQRGTDPGIAGACTT